MADRAATTACALPEPGPAVPRAGGALRGLAGRLCLALLGWRIEGAAPDVPRCVAILAPHTSNWDFVIALATIFALRVRVVWLGKDALFRGPFRRLLGWIGGVPVARGSPEGVVEAAVARLTSGRPLWLGLAPEGTRRRVERWKSGFYRIAVAARVPILLVSLDYRSRSVGLGPLVEPSGDYDRDLARMRSRFASAMARYPDQYQDPALDPGGPGPG